MIPPKPADDPSLPWCLANREAIPEYLASVYRLSRMGAIVTNAGVTSPYPVRWSARNASVNFERASLVQLNPETIVWRNRAIAAGGTFASNSISLADALINAIAAASFNSKIIYLLPILGGNLATALVPLRDTLGVSSPTNSNFVDADFTQATGLQGNGTTKVLDSKIKPSQLGTGSNGGIGFWENNLSFSATGALIAYSLQTDPNPNNYDYFYISAGSSASEFAWNVNTGAFFTTYSTPSVNGHYYGQRASATSRTLYLNGTSVAVTTGSNGAPGASGGNFFILGTNRVGASTGYHNGRCAVAYMTDGTLTGAEVTAFNTLLQTYLITPTGR